MKSDKPLLTDTRGYLQLNRQVGGGSLSRPNSNYATSISNNSSEKKVILQRESPRARFQPNKTQAPSIQALKQLSTNLFGSPRSNLPRPPLNLQISSQLGFQKAQQETNLVSFRPYDTQPSVKRQIDFSEPAPITSKVNVNGLLHRVSRVEDGLSE